MSTTEPARQLEPARRREMWALHSVIVLIDGRVDGKEAAAIATLAAVVFAALFAFLNEWNKNRLRRKGLARVLADEMRRAQSALVRARFRQRWWADEEYLAPRVNEDDDIKRIATALKQGEWADC